MSRVIVDMSTEKFKKGDRVKYALHKRNTEGTILEEVDTSPGWFSVNWDKYGQANYKSEDLILIRRA